MRTKKEKWHKIRMKGLRRRWLKNTGVVILALGLVCVLAITASFSAYYYSEMESDLRQFARSSTVLFSGVNDLEEQELYLACIAFVENQKNLDNIELQFVDSKGQVIASSSVEQQGNIGLTSDMKDAVDTRGPSSFLGTEPVSGKRIMAASSPIIRSDGEVMGVIRYVTSTDQLDRQIVTVAIVATCVLCLVMAVILFCSNYYIRSIVVPLEEIIEKSKRIANGSYGIQIQTKYDDEIGDLARMTNELSLKISENEKMQRDFISSLSHELRTPLTAITGWSETLLSSDKLDNDTRRGVRIIHREADRLTGMVVDLLDFTRIQDDRMTLNMEVVDIRGEFEDTVFVYGSRLAEEGISLKYVDNDQEIPEISCDPQRLRQVFLNILNNAVKHGGEGKRIDASIVYKDDFVDICIRDYGPGIPEDELALVKKKFYKGSSKARGSGIGLAVSDEIVQMHGGELILENALSGGTLVTVRLPATQ